MPIKYSEPRRRYSILIPESLAVEFEFLLPLDSRTGRSEYGAVSRTVARLIAEYVREHKTPSNER